MRARKLARVGRGVAVGQRGGRAQQVGDGAPAGGQDGGAEQYQEPAGGRLGEGGCEGLEDRLGFGRSNHAVSVLGRWTGVRVQLLKLPLRRTLSICTSRAKGAPENKLTVSDYNRLTYFVLGFCN